MECKICNDGKDYFNLSNHVCLKHHISPKEYYDTYLKTFENTHCLVCKCELTKFFKLSSGYGRYCSKCSGNKYAWNLMSNEKKKNKQERYVKTCIERFGVDNPAKNSKVHEKIKETCENWTDDKKALVHEHRLDGRKKVDWEKQNTLSKQTKLQRYGDKNYNNVEKARKTYFERTGYVNPYYNPDVIEHRFDDYEKRTGYANPSHNPDVIAKMRRRYTYQDVGFDSSWELAFFIWLKDNGKEFKFHHLKPIDYTFNGKKHRYFPDFEIDDMLIEIKNPELLKRMQKPNTIDNAKYNCMIENGVKIITDCSMYIEYVCEKYGKHYLEQYRNK